ncbi:serine/threonine-protein kinase pim-2-like [Erpetoichthys calabaricus]|uniref:serine/threonine-protein kinase pim-2-like n=1 Tax=Erpetoichthys calabaricus TaxID=27687 RepID=UPI0022345F31|nr:serine/threonine-protein kinase pim-2-like [Erpetoichthys calabaricus]
MKIAINFILSNLTSPLLFFLDYDALSENYLVGQVLGTGGFGEVRAGRRKSDHLPVAIKRIKRQSVSHSMSPPNDTESVPLELALMQLVSRPPACPAVIQLLDWVITQSCVFLVMERPDPCMDLFDFMWERGQCLTEPIAGSIFRQVVQAVHHCQSRGVLHRDIKPENILVETSTQQTKLIDFGCGTLLNQKEYTSFTGTHFYAPPEWCLKKSYEAEPATVWSLGVLLFEMLCGQVPFKRKEEVIRCNVIYTADISKECASLIKKCLSRSPKERPTLEEILMHPWVC